MQQSRAVKIWDPLIRIFHWSLVVTFTIAYLSADEESVLHTWSGYAVLGLALFRILWGFIGSQHARFSDFVYPPSVIVSYARDTLLGRAKRYLGHNPLGGPDDSFHARLAAGDCAYGAIGTGTNRST